MTQDALFATFFQAGMPIKSTPTSSRRTAITTDSSISVVPRWRPCLLVVLRSFTFCFPIGTTITGFYQRGLISGERRPYVGRGGIWAERSSCALNRDRSGLDGYAKQLAQPDPSNAPSVGSV